MPDRVRPGDGVFRRCLRLAVSFALLALLHTVVAGGLVPAAAVERDGCPGRGPVAAGAGPESGPAVVATAASGTHCAGASHTASADPRSGLGCHQGGGLPGPRDGSAARRPVTGAVHPGPAHSGASPAIHGPDRIDGAGRTPCRGAAAPYSAPAMSVSHLRC